MGIKGLGVPVLCIGGIAVVLTIAPFFLPISWWAITRILHWLMVVTDRPHAGWLPLNAGKRTISLFAINVLGWALSLVFVWIVARLATAKHKST
jgi:hypothetical protein